MTEDQSNNSNILEILQGVYDENKFILISYAIILLVFFGFALITPLFFNILKDKNDDIQEFSSVVSVKDTSYGISFKKPKSWKLREAGSDDEPNVLIGVKDLFQVLLPEPEKDQQSYRAKILFSTDKNTNFNDLEVYADKQIKIINDINKINFPNTKDINNCPKAFIIRKSQPIELDNYSAHEIIYQGHNEEYNLKRRRIVVESPTIEDQFLIITYNAHVKNFDKYESDFEQIVKSIKLFKE